MPLINPNELSADAIANLLSKPTRTSKPKEEEKVVSPTRYARSYGPVSTVDQASRCTSRGCGVSTIYRLDGVPYCSVHIIDRLNKRTVEREEQYTLSLDDCTCKSGGYSTGRLHTQDCQLYESL